MKVFVGVVVVLSCVGTFAEPIRFAWKLKGTQKTERFVAQDVPAKGPYSVRFKAALTDAAGGFLRLQVDGVWLCSKGTGLMLDDSKESQVIPGQIDEVNPGIQLRDRRFHEIAFVCFPQEIVLFGDGVEKTRIPKKPDAPCGFEIVGERVDLEVKGLEVAAGDKSEAWYSRNWLVNAGLEDLHNGYAPYWGPNTFGFGGVEEIADLEKARATYRIDSTVAWEGTNAMYLGCNRPLWESWQVRPKNTDYVFSAYVKGTVPGSRVRLKIDSWYKEVAGTTATVGVDWVRVELPFNNGDKAQFRCGVQAAGDSKVWVDALQLERGKKATAFVPHPSPVIEPTDDPPAVMDHYYATITPHVAKVRHAPRQARVDPKRNSFRFDGKEYFFYGFCSMGLIDTPDWYRAMDRFKEWGFNVNTAWSGAQFPKSAEVLRKLLDASEARGIKTIVVLRYDEKKGEVDAQQLEVIRANAGHPNLLSVDMMDEACQRVPPQKRKEAFDYVRKVLGNQVPLSANEYDYGVLMHMDFSDADVATGDFYVVGMQEVSAQYYILKTLRDDNPDQVVGYYPIAGGHFSTWPRDPSPDEVLAQAYIGYVLEVFNMKWWQAVPLTKPALDAVIQAKRERDRIDPSAFLDGTPAAVTCQSRNDAVKFTARTLPNGVTRIIAINIENRPNAATWTLPAEPKRVTPLIGKGPDSVSGKTISDRFGPLERRVFDLK